MSSDKPKCSNKDHSSDPATVFCKDCGKFFCASCSEFHEKILSDHNTVPVKDISSGSQVITRRCTIPGHHNNPLEYYCKEHNVPCCGMCLCPKEGVGKHTKCTTVPLPDMEQQMRSSLIPSIKALEEATAKAEATMAKLRTVQEGSEAAKEEAMDKIKKCFVAIRDAVDAREKELLEKAEKLWDEEASCEKLMSVGISCPEKAKCVTAAAKIAEEHWDSSKLPEMAQHCAAVSELKATLDKFISDVDKAATADLKIKWVPREDDVAAFLSDVKKFGDVVVRLKFDVRIKDSPNGMYAVEGPSRGIVKKISRDSIWDCTAIGEATIPPNTLTSWDVKIVSTSSGNIMIGVAPFDINQATNCNCDKCGWYFYCCGSTLYSGPPHKYSNKQYGQGKQLKNGDVVGVVMDTAKGELLFVVNGVSLGVAYKGIPLDKPLVPAIDFYNTNDIVEVNP